MKAISNSKDLIEWAREINFGVDLHRKCDLQDIYAHTKQTNIDKFFIESELDRRLVICSISNAMSFDEVERLLSVLARYKCEKILQNEEKRLADSYSDISRRETMLEKNKRSIARKISEYRKESEYFKERTSHFRELYQRENLKRLKAQDNSKRFNIIKRALTD